VLTLVPTLSSRLQGHNRADRPFADAHSPSLLRESIL
jgi:hypothetical protein